MLMTRIYYLDTSIWLDFFENRNEPNIPKGDWARELLAKIIKNDDKVVYSDIVLIEFGSIGYPPEEIQRMFDQIRPILLFVESTSKHLKKAKDLSAKRDIPKGDALHALLSREHKATLVTLDWHFQKLADISKAKRPQDLI